MSTQGFTSVRGIAAQLNERGVLTARGGSWHPTSAARLLSGLQRQAELSDHTQNKGVVDVRIIASVTIVALFSATTVPALADQFEWGPLTTLPKNDQNTIWNAHCNDSSEHVVSGQCTITSGSGTLQNVGVNDERDTWTCEWGQTVKASARALCTK
jgi:hypothetical protein